MCTGEDENWNAQPWDLRPPIVLDPYEFLKLLSEASRCWLLELETAECEGYSGYLYATLDGDTLFIHVT